MEKEILRAIVSIVIALIGAIASIIVADKKVKKSVKEEIKTKSKSIINKAKIDFRKINGIDKRIAERMSSLEKSPYSTESIDVAWMEGLTKFVETYRIKIDALELFDASIPSDFYYNFAVYYAFIKKDFITANFFIKKSLDIDKDKEIKDKIHILRWAARINRLNRNESEAANYLTDILKEIDAVNFPYKDIYDDIFKAKILRSRGFCYFNMYKYDGAIQDFKQSINYSEISKDSKLPYCLCGIAMSLYRKNKRDIQNNIKIEEYIIEKYKESVELEPNFYGENNRAFENNMIYLEEAKKYYFSEFEKITLEDVYELCNAKQAD